MLPETLKITVSDEDIRKAICGSPTRCTIANALRRQVDELSFVKVNPNQITITAAGYTHHYAMPNAGLNVVMENDDGTLALGKDRTIKLKQTDRPAKAWVKTPGRQEQINEARKARAEAGKPDKKYPVNVRVAAAKKAGLAYKRLIPAVARAG